MSAGGSFPSRTCFKYAAMTPPQTLGKFHQDIPHEAVTDDDIGLTGEEVHPLYVTDEVQVAPLEKLVSLRHLAVTLGLLCPGAEEPHCGPFNPQKCPGEDAAHGGEVQ